MNTYNYYSKPGLAGLGRAGPVVKPGPKPSRALYRAWQGSGFLGPGRAGLRALGPARTSLMRIL